MPTRRKVLTIDNGGARIVVETPGTQLRYRGEAYKEDILRRALAWAIICYRDKGVHFHGGIEFARDIHLTVLVKKNSAIADAFLVEYEAGYQGEKYDVGEIEDGGPGLTWKDKFMRIKNDKPQGLLRWSSIREFILFVMVYRGRSTVTGMIASNSHTDLCFDSEMAPPPKFMPALPAVADERKPEHTRRNHNTQKGYFPSRRPMRQKRRSKEHWHARLQEQHPTTLD
ncbi:MAG: hypothetical protein J3R72DRAFT_495172 [Linnemannia gamsii]|nr:MAG: hypothetical protein J3R72DRAFT_495172 [Linnemannia gamsii]